MQEPEPSRPEAAATNATRQEARPGPTGLFLGVLRFYSRLPVPVFRFEAAPHALPDFRRGVLAIPFAGLVIGLVGAAAGGFGYYVGLSTSVAAALAIAALVIATGAFHEDGLADCADGFWGGATPERRREIMKDSRVGTFGAAALVLGLSLRILTLAELFRLVGPAALIVLPGIAALSRPLALLPVIVSPPAPGNGLAAAVPMPGATRLFIAIAIGIALFAGAAYAANLAAGLPAALLSALALVALGARLAEKKIGGHSGDVLGACQQLAEIAMLMALSAAANWQGPV